MSIILMTDSASDLPLEYIKENNIDYVSLSVNIKGDFIKDDFGQTLKHKDFYKLLREGEMTSTAQVNVFDFQEKFEKHVKDGNSIIYIGLSGPLSGTVNSARIAKENILEEYPNADISIIDSKAVSLGIGSLVYYANKMIKEGKEKSEIVAWVEGNVNKVIHAIVVDDLSHLKRGGRISAATAVVGGLLNIKPSIVVDEEGKIVPGAKIKGKKKVIKYLCNEVKEKAVDLENQTLFICHADAIDSALELKEAILSELKVADIMISELGTVIGTHGGPGTLATVFLGKNR